MSETVLDTGNRVRGDGDHSDEAMGRHVAPPRAGQTPVRAEAAAFGKATVSTPPKRTSVKLRLADGSEADCRAGIHLAREAHLHTVFRDIPFSEGKARAIFDKATGQPDRFGLIYAVPGAEGPPAEDGLLGFASVQAGEHFLGHGTLIATVQTLNISQRLSGTLLGGRVALRLVQAVRQWSRERDCRHLLVHVTNGENAEDADRFFRRCGMVTVGAEYLHDTNNH